MRSVIIRRPSVPRGSRLDPTLLLSLGAIVVGFVLLIWGADRFIAGAAALAQDLGVPKLLVGLTVVGLGTSAPEMFVAGVAALQDKPGLAIGNAIGSNVTNIALILGVTALVAPLVVQNSVLKRELPVLSLVCVGATVLMADGDLTRVDGGVLAVGLLGTLVWMARMARSGTSTALDDEMALDVPEQAPIGRAVLWTVVGLIALPLSSQILVWGAVNLANAFGLSDLVIGLTIVALGTSLPELAASVAGALKGEPEIALGNVLGSNMFNLLVVLAMPALIAPGAVEAAVLTRDLPVMLGLTAVLYLMCVGWRGPGRVTRLEGSLLLLAFVGYTSILLIAG